MSNALAELIALEKEAVEFGFEWPNEEAILEQVVSECKEITSAIQEQESAERIQEEIGDLIHTSISLCRFAGFDVEATLVKTIEKFSHRLKALKQITHSHKLDSLEGQSTKFMLELWDEAKKLDK